MLRTYLVVMLGGAIGTVFRMAIAAALAARFGEKFPLGTIAVNVLGSFVIGLFAALTAKGGVAPAPALLRQFVMVGVLGGFTTFSSFSLQTLQLAQTGAWALAAGNVLLSVVLCLGAVGVGHALGGALLPR